MTSIPKSNLSSKNNSIQNLQYNNPNPNYLHLPMPNTSNLNMSSMSLPMGMNVSSSSGGGTSHHQDMTLPDDDTDLNALTDEQHEQRLQDMLIKFWNTQTQEMTELAIDSEQEFKNHNDLPLARIKRIMKSDEDVRMISAEAPVLFAKACEMFILELSIRAWGAAEKSKRRTLQKEDVDAAIKNTDIFDFLEGLS